jgi:hypothetical protein
MELRTRDAKDEVALAQFWGRRTTPLAQSSKVLAGGPPVCGRDDRRRTDSPRRPPPVAAPH